ncbi:hypothetical protein J6590_022426 [Homalodisca vitripennis]|nr:hypothetical protein J6590_022426 [Homalodisca vitripennis]
MVGDMTSNPMVTQKNWKEILPKQSLIGYGYPLCRLGQIKIALTEKGVLPSSTNLSADATANRPRSLLKGYPRTIHQRGITSIRRPRRANNKNAKKEIRSNEYPIRRTACYTMVQCVPDRVQNVGPIFPYLNALLWLRHPVIHSAGLQIVHTKLGQLVQIVHNKLRQLLQIVPNKLGQLLQIVPDKLGQLLQIVPNKLGKERIWKIDYSVTLTQSRDWPIFSPLAGACTGGGEVTQRPQCTQNLCPSGQYSYLEKSCSSLGED